MKEVRIYPTFTPNHIKFNMQLKRFKNNSETDDNVEPNSKMFLNRFLMRSINKVNICKKCFITINGNSEKYYGFCNMILMRKSFIEGAVDVGYYKALEE